jgi:hypothetical protein
VPPHEPGQADAGRALSDVVDTGLAQGDVVVERPVRAAADARAADTRPPPASLSALLSPRSTAVSTAARNNQAPDAREGARRGWDGRRHGFTEP